jgi:hypothetical protein
MLVVIEEAMLDSFTFKLSLFDSYSLPGLFLFWETELCIRYY